MAQTTYHYDEEADVLYISFGSSDRVASVELSEHLLLRLDMTDENNAAPRAIGLTLLFPAQLMQLGYRPMQLDLERLRQLPTHLPAIVLEALASPPISEVLTAELAFASDIPALPQLMAA